MRTKPKVIVTRALADTKSGLNEKIAEFVFPDGTGGLISFLSAGKGKPNRVCLYNVDFPIDVKVSKCDNETPSPENQALIDRGNALGRKYQELSERRSALLHDYDQTTIEMHHVFREMNAIGNATFPGRKERNLRILASETLAP